MEHPAHTFCAEFGRRVERRRRILGLTQRQVGERIGLHRSHISLLESGGYQSMKFEQLALLANVLQTSLDYLLLRTDDDPGVIPPSPCPGGACSLDGVTLPPVTLTPEGVTANAEYTTI